MKKIIFLVAAAFTLLLGSVAISANTPVYAIQQATDAGNTSSSVQLDTTASGPPTNQYASQINVTIQNMAFMPSTLTIWQGTTVTWTNQDNITHTVTSDADQGNTSFDSGSIQPGQQYSYTFVEPGTFSYHCSIHPTMTGTVIVKSMSQQPTPSMPNPNPPHAPANSSPTNPSISAQASASATVNNYSSCTQPAVKASTTTTTTSAQPSAAYYKPAATYSGTPATTTLPSTGPASTVGIAAITTVLGTSGYYIYLLRHKKLV